MINLITAVSIITLCAVDQLIKLAVKNYLLPLGSVVIIPRVLELKYVENTGAAFGSMSNNTFALSVFTSALIIACLVALFSGKVKDKVLRVCLVMIVSGGMGNLLDRMFRGTKFFCGYVIDYINLLFVDFAVFNFADCLITVGCFVLIFYVLFADKFKKKKVKKDD
ncbi:MAG: signal peptidase II [Clostridia bacterium]|nr:signal peptidase II [Clostridia bacterium]